MNLKLNDFIINELNLNINDVSIKTKLSGLNNECYKIEYLNTPYFIRICNKSKDMEEKNIIKICAQNNIAPRLLYYSAASGNMVTEWINGHMPNEREFSSIGFIADLTTKLKTLHSLKCCKHFNPFNEIKKSLLLCEKNQLQLPTFINILIDKLKTIEYFCLENMDIGLCHNDLNPSNILITGNDLYFIDYEFSAIGDIFYDLATLSWMMNDEAKENLLKLYFHNPTNYHYKKLTYYLYVVKFWNACWSLLKSKDNTSTYDYKKGAEMIFEDLWQNYSLD